jgi:hypothetical protein
MNLTPKEILNFSILLEALDSRKKRATFQTPYGVFLVA